MPSQEAEEEAVVTPKYAALTQKQLNAEFNTYDSQAKETDEHIQGHLRRSFMRNSESREAGCNTG